MNLRAYYRLVFPLGARPWLVVGSHLHPVLDCSERGLRVRMEPWDRPAVRAEVRGRLRLPNGEEQEVAGSVLRHTAEGVALALAGRGIHFGTMLRLQLFVRRLERLAAEAVAAPGAGR